MLACFCLNILLDTDGGDFEKVTPETLKLNEREKNDGFFEQEIQRVRNVTKITKVHASLVYTRAVGSWIIHHCVNCDCQTYAEDQTSCFLVNSRLLNSDAISSVKSSDEFSPIYKIIVNPNNIGQDNKVSDTYRQFDSDWIIKDLRQLMSEYLNQEAIAVETNILKYTDEQYEVLNNLRERGYKEYESLARLIKMNQNMHMDKSTTKNITGSLSAPFKQTDQTLTDKLSTASPTLSDRRSPKRQKSSPAAPSRSLDAELLFEFESSDGIRSLSETDKEESDREDGTEEVFNVSRGRPSKGSIAKSLPMNIPTFMSQTRSRSADEDLDDMSQDDNLDIAASIKALAKSVHGDTVFGDLPRPRFSTQI